MTASQVEPAAASASNSVGKILIRRYSGPFGNCLGFLSASVLLTNFCEGWLSPEMITCLAADHPGKEFYLEDLAAQPDDHRPFSKPFTPAR